MAIFDTGDLDRMPRFSITTGDQPLSAEDQALLATPEAQEIVRRYPSWGPERIRAELRRRG